ncbi:MAG TPA: hypothetical protein VJ788_00925, partial [Gemmatimonadota bacterium]|nr:hypothetical protein [Gemmatimonadota bacterium]
MTRDKSMLTGVCRRVLLLVASAATFAAPRAGAAQTLRSLPLDHWVYGVTDELLLRHPELGRGLWLGNRPWREADFLILLARADSAGLGEVGRRESTWIELLRRVFPERAAGAGAVAIHNEASLRLAAHASRDDAAFDPSFLGVRFEEPDGDPPIPALRGVLQHDFAVQYRERFALGWRYGIDSDVTGDPTRFRQLEAREGTDYG